MVCYKHKYSCSTCKWLTLQDTKSSNGTFVNNNKLSTVETDLPHEVCSGDIVQFGVDVVENNRRVTHCCIVATLKLYLPDGKEAKASPSITEHNRPRKQSESSLFTLVTVYIFLVPMDELFELHRCLQEACQREQVLEAKLNTLQRMLAETRRSADESWQVWNLHHMPTIEVSWWRSRKTQTIYSHNFWNRIVVLFSKIQTTA